MSAETDTQRCGDPTCRTNGQCAYPDYTLCGRRQGATDREPGTDHDDTEAIDTITRTEVRSTTFVRTRSSGRVLCFLETT